MRIGIILGSAAHARVIGGDGHGLERISPLAATGQLLGEAERLPEAPAPYGMASSPVYRTAFGEGSHHFLWLFRHGVGEEAILPHRINYAANIHALAHNGAELIIAFNLVGSLIDEAPPGSHATPDQVIDYTWGRCASMREIGELPPNITVARHLDFTEPFHEPLRCQWRALAAKAGVEVRDGGVCAVTQGPRLESKAEVARIGIDGGAYVNMTLCPEVALARELGIDYLCSAFVSNWAAGVRDSERVIDIGESMRLAEAGLGEFMRIIDTWSQEPAALEPGPR